jgi:hypothetical protein
MNLFELSHEYQIGLIESRLYDRQNEDGDLLFDESVLPDLFDLVDLGGQEQIYTFLEAVGVDIEHLLYFQGPFLIETDYNQANEDDLNWLRRASLKNRLRLIQEEFESWSTRSLAGVAEVALLFYTSQRLISEYPGLYEFVMSRTLEWYADDSMPSFAEDFILENIAIVNPIVSQFRDFAASIRRHVIIVAKVYGTAIHCYGFEETEVLNCVGVLPVELEETPFAFLEASEDMTPIASLLPPASTFLSPFAPEQPQLPAFSSPIESEAAFTIDFNEPQFLPEASDFFSLAPASEPELVDRVVFSLPSLEQPNRLQLNGSSDEDA